HGGGVPAGRRARRPVPHADARPVVRGGERALGRGRARDPEAASPADLAALESRAVVVAREYVEVPVDGRMMRTFLVGPRAAGAPLGAAGHCTGGHLAFRAALLPEIRATACWYPTGLHDGKLGADPDAGSLARAEEIDGELLLIFGTRDPHTPEAGRETIRRRLEQAGTRLTWREYDAEHAFGRDVGDRYDPEVTDEAFAETVALFRRVLVATAV